MPADPPFPRPVDENHALLIGALIGAVTATRDLGFRYEPWMIDDDEGNHLATFGIRAESGFYLVHVEKSDMQEQLLATRARLQDRGKSSGQTPP